MKRAVLLFAASAVAACGAEPKVVRVYDGKVVEGRYVSPDGYASYLRAVLAEENGDLKGALSHLDLAVADDDEDAEVWARIGEVRCKADPKDAKADEAFGRALKADPSYAGALAAKSRCELARGHAEAAVALAKKGLDADPGNVAIDALLVRADARRPNAQLRDRAVALTIAHGERAAAWDALVAWSTARRDAELCARGLEGLLRAAPIRAPEVEKGVLALAGQGHLALARRVAATIADSAPELLVRGPQDPTVGRLAVDEALVRGDAASALRRATRGHVELSEVAARATLLERPEAAKEIAQTVVRADPAATGARMVLAALDASTKGGHDALAKGDDAPELCALVLADRLATAAGIDVARSWLDRVARRPLAPHDPLGGPIAVDLAARGVLQESALVPETRIELAARRRESPPPLPKDVAIDERHELLFHALTEPTGAAARTLAANLASAIERDPVVAFAVSRVALASGQAGDGTLERLRRAMASSPASALLLSAVVEIAQRGGRTDELAPARTRLMAVARTAAERALAAE
jgi:tetratricopeptide (TPR) repeat protein